MFDIIRIGGSYMDDILLTIIIVVGVIALIFIIWYFSTLNSFKRAIIKIEEADSGIDVALAKRYNVLTQMIETVKGYMKHEQELMVKVIELRKGMSIDEKNSANKEMDDAFRQVRAVAEGYPDLKASDNFKVLQNAIVDVEEHLQAARRLYNSNVSLYNQKIEVFPGNVIAKSKNYTKKQYFEASDEEKVNVEVKVN